MRLWLLGIVTVLALAFFFNPVSVIENSSDLEQPTQNNDEPLQEQAIQSKPKTPKAQQFENELAQQMSVLANHYEQSIRFPHYSIPINSGQTDLLEPLKVLPVVLNLGEGVDSSASLTPAQYIVKHGDPIIATLSSSGPIKAKQVKIELVENNQKIKSFSVEAKDGKFVGTIKKSDDDWPVDLHIKATFDLGEHGRLSILSPIKYSPDNGTIMATREPYIDGANLSIPVELNIKQAGRYRLTANFFNQQKGPIAHLSAKQNLKKGDNTWTLQVHSEVLRSVDNPGPYLLDTWTLTKLPERPGIRTSFGDSKIGEVKIEGFDLKDYATTAWNDPQDQARLEFFKKLK